MRRPDLVSVPAPPRGERSARDPIDVPKVSPLSLVSFDEPSTNDPRDDDACEAPGYETRLTTLTEALIEACLLLQRVAMTTPTTNTEIHDRVRELLQLVER